MHVEGDYSCTVQQNPLKKTVRVQCITVVLGLITQWIPTVDPCVLVKVGLLIPTVG